MKMYSLESYLYREINRASRERDQSKIANLGPYAFVLTKIIQRIIRAEEKRKMFQRFDRYINPKTD